MRGGCYPGSVRVQQRKPAPTLGQASVRTLSQRGGLTAAATTSTTATTSPRRTSGSAPCDGTGRPSSTARYSPHTPTTERLQAFGRAGMWRSPRGRPRVVMRLTKSRRARGCAAGKLAKPASRGCSSALRSGIGAFEGLGGTGRRYRRSSAALAAVMEIVKGAARVLKVRDEGRDAGGAITVSLPAGIDRAAGVGWERPERALGGGWNTQPNSVPHFRWKCGGRSQPLRSAEIRIGGQVPRNQTTTGIPRIGPV